MKIELLDHGYLQLVESWGSDERIIESARMSTNKGFLGWGPKDGKPGDEKLLAFLYKNKHLTPFEMAGVTIEVQAPILVFREWHRHRTQSYSELSSRYTAIPDFNYIPTVERLMLNSKTNKQAGTIKDAEELTLDNAERFQFALKRMYDEDQWLYDKYLKLGVPKELARVHLPVGRYSRMRASGNLRNWLGFLHLRMAENAQWEIRQYANALAKVVEQTFPRTYTLFRNENI